MLTPQPAPAWPDSAVRSACWSAPPGLPRQALRLAWQAALHQLPEAPQGPLSPELRGSTRVGWRSTQGHSLRVSYGHWPLDAAPPPGGVHSIVLVAWRTTPMPLRWAVDCAPQAPLPDADALLALYGSRPNADAESADAGQAFGIAWAQLEAAAKLVGGLTEGVSPPRPPNLRTQRLGDWAVVLASQPIFPE